MDAPRDGLSEARLADDGADDVSAVDCTTTPRCRRPTTPSSVVAASTSGSCSPRDDDSSTEDVDDDAGLALLQARDDADSPAATTTSVPLLEELVSSPCDVVAPVHASSAADTSAAPPATDDDAEGQRSLNKSFLQKLESFVSSVGQVVPAARRGPPLTGWMRRPVFACRSGAAVSGSMPMTTRRPSPADFFPSPSESASTRPLDLSAKRTESPAVRVDNVRSSQPRHDSFAQRHGSGDGGVRERFVDMSEVQSNGANSLACLERDFGEHSTILTRLGSCRDRQRQAAAAAAFMTTASRRSRNAAMPGLTAVHHSAGARGLRPSGTVAAPSHAEDARPPRSFVDRSRRPLPPTTDRACVLNASKLNPRHPLMMSTAAALRCLQCGRTFHSLPELTLHMIQTAHYANLICAAAAYSVRDDVDDCVAAATDAYDGRRSSNGDVDHYAHRPGALQLSRGKGVTEMTDARGGGDGLYRSGDVSRRGYVDAAVSPARSLDDESVSSAGLTETESLRSPTSTDGSPTSPSYENVAGDDDDGLALMSHLLRLQPLLSRTAVDGRQAGTAVPHHVEWMAVGLAAAEERRRQLLVERSPKTAARQLDRSPAVDSLPIDLRSQRADGGRYRDSHSRQMPCLAAAAKMHAFASRQSPAAYLEKLLDDVRGYGKSLDAGVKRPASSRWYNGKHRTKKRRAYGTLSSDCDQTKYDGRQLDGDRSAVVSAVGRTSGELCRRTRDDGIRGCGEVASSVKMSPPMNHERRSSRREETPDGARRPSSRDVAAQPRVVDGGTADSPGLSVLGRDADVASGAGRDFRRPGVSRDQSEYAARFGKYYRLAQELASKSD